MQIFKIYRLNNTNIAAVYAYPDHKKSPQNGDHFYCVFQFSSVLTAAITAAILNIMKPAKQPQMLKYSGNRIPTSKGRAIKAILTIDDIINGKTSLASVSLRSLKLALRMMKYIMKQIIPRTMPEDILQLMTVKTAASSEPHIPVMRSILFSINYLVPKIRSPASPRPGTI